MGRRFSNWPGTRRRVHWDGGVGMALLFHYQHSSWIRWDIGVVPVSAFTIANHQPYGGTETGGLARHVSTYAQGYKILIFNIEKARSSLLPALS